MNYVIRNATPQDLDQILRVEQSWPETARAPREKFIARLEKFPDGFFVAEQDGQLLATITACPLHYDPAQPHRLKNWDTVTNNGFLHDIGPLTGYNSLYIVSGVIDPRHRGGDLFERMVGREAQLARALGFGFVLAGAVLPGYARYCEKHGALPAADYVFLRHGPHWVDPLLDMYARIGFAVPDRQHVIKDYFPDAASRDHAALVVCTL